MGKTLALPAGVLARSDPAGPKSGKSIGQIAKDLGLADQSLDGEKHPLQTGRPASPQFLDKPSMDCVTLAQETCH
jgi:hypothetical protein